MSRDTKHYSQMMAIVDLIPYKDRFDGQKNDHTTRDCSFTTDYLEPDLNFGTIIYIIYIYIWGQTQRISISKQYQSWLNI